MTLQVQRPKPIASQVTEILTERIRTHTYEPGSRLPSEEELARELRVSRATVRSALARMAAEGLVVRRQGAGTYVNEHMAQAPMHLGGMWDFLQLIENSGCTPSTTLLSQKTRIASSQEAGALNLPANADVLTLRRLFCADGRPVILAESVIPVELVRRPLQPDDGALPIRRLLQRHCDQNAAYTIIDIRADSPDESIRKLLQLETSTPLLRLEQVFFNHDNAPLLYSVSNYNDAILGMRLVHVWR